MPTKDYSVGFNPEETLLSSAGACITSSLGLVAKNSTVVSTLREAVELSVSWRR